MSGSIEVVQFLARSQDACQGFFIKYYSYCHSSLRTAAHKCRYCQKAMTWMRCDCEAQDIFLWKERSHRNLVKRHDQIYLWVEGLLEALYIPLENVRAMYLCHLKMESPKWFFFCLFLFFQKPWNIFSSSFIRTENTATWSLLFTGLFSQHIKVKNEIICHNLSLLLFKFHFFYSKLSTGKLIFTLNTKSQVHQNFLWVLAQIVFWIL